MHRKTVITHSIGVLVVPCFVIEYEDVLELDVSSLSSSGISTVDLQRSILGQERPGQLYAYRYSNTTVVLATRNASFLGAKVGIGNIATGTYKCRAQNTNATSERELTIIVLNNGECITMTMSLV